MDDLPPLDEPIAWVVVREHERVGPYTLNLLIEEVLADRLSPTTPVWWPPLVDWTTISGFAPLWAEIHARRNSDAPGWAPPAVSAGVFLPLDTNSGPDGEQRSTHVLDVADVVDVEVIEAELIEPEPDVDDPQDEGHTDIVEAIIMDSPMHPENTDFIDLVGRSAGVADRLAAIATVDDAFVSTMVAVGDHHGLSFADHHSGVDEHRINLRDVSGDRELTILLGRVGTGRADVTVNPVVTLSMLLSTRNLARPSDPTDPLAESGGEYVFESAESNRADGHGHIDVSFDDRSGRTTANVALFLGVPDYVDDHLVVDPYRLRTDLDAVVVALMAAADQ